MSKLIETYKLGDVIVEYCKYSTDTCPDFYYLLDASMAKSRAKLAMVENDIVIKGIQLMFE